jgi:hypothetical protein
MGFLRFQPKIGHALKPLPMQQNLLKSVQNCPKLPKFAQTYPNTISLRNFKKPTKIVIVVFLVLLKIKKGYL